MTKKGILERLNLIKLKEEQSPEQTKSSQVETDPAKTESIENPIKELVEKEKIEQSVIINKDDASIIGEKLDVLIESYEKNKYVTVEEIYRSKSLDKDVKLTVFIVEVFMKALPENLPMDIKKKSILNILDASGMKKEELLNDAYVRIDALNTVLEETVAKTAEMRDNNDKTIAELTERIEMLKRASEDRAEFEDKQTTTVEYEIQRIINIVDSIK